jgi:hypothetical protein
MTEVKETIALKLQAKISEVQLFFAGKEMPDQLEIGNVRVRPPAFILVVTVSFDPILLESLPALHEQPSPYKFVRKDGESFELSFLSSYFIDRVRICVADKLNVPAETVNIWQNDRLLADDVILGNLGENRTLEVVLNDNVWKPSVLLAVRRSYAAKLHVQATNPGICPLGCGTKREYRF